MDNLKEKNNLELMNQRDVLDKELNRRKFVYYLDNLTTGQSKKVIAYLSSLINGHPMMTTEEHVKFLSDF